MPHRTRAIRIAFVCLLTLLAAGCLGYVARRSPDRAAGWLTAMAAAGLGALFSGSAALWWVGLSTRRAAHPTTQPGHLDGQPGLGYPYAVVPPGPGLSPDRTRLLPVLPGPNDPPVGRVIPPGR
ncbi:MAG TPA: hypothetical protein VLJ59_16285 [Mycobacteriales bacterium]|nr:hypothetical protein [Mycobacteriales bacterium]